MLGPSLLPWWWWGVFLNRPTSRGFPWARAPPQPPLQTRTASAGHPELPASQKLQLCPWSHLHKGATGIPLPSTLASLDRMLWAPTLFGRIQRLRRGSLEFRAAMYQRVQKYSIEKSKELAEGRLSSQTGTEQNSFLCLPSLGCERPGLGHEPH